MPKKLTKKVESEDENDEFEDIVEEDDDEGDDEEDNESLSDDEEDKEIAIEGNDEIGCVYDEIEEDFNLYNDNDIDMVAETNEFVPKESRISAGRLTKYEMVRILGERTKQLTMGAKPMIKNYKELPYDKIAEEEFKRNMIPYKIKRPLPNGKYEIWTLDELYKEHLMSYLE